MRIKKVIKIILSKIVCNKNESNSECSTSCYTSSFSNSSARNNELRIQPEVKNLKCDDKVWVSEDGENWYRRHFKRYDSELDVVYAWNNGLTSWTTGSAMRWPYAQLPK